MLKKTLALLILLIVCSAFFVGGLLAQARSPGTHSSGQASSGLIILMTPPPGIVSAARIRHDILTYGFPGGPTVSGKPPTIVKMELLTVAQMRALGAEGMYGLADTAPVYFVLLRGPFVPSGISVPPGVKISTVQRGDEIIDARTGRITDFGVA
jgi:hypothetical protein